MVFFLKIETQQLHEMAYVYIAIISYISKINLVSFSFKKLNELSSIALSLTKSVYIKI